MLTATKIEIVRAEGPRALCVKVAFEGPPFWKRFSSISRYYKSPGSCEGNRGFLFGVQEPMPFPWPIYTRKDALKETVAWLREKTPESPQPDTWAHLQQQVLALGDDPDLDEVDQILAALGRRPGEMTRQKCDECDELCDAVVRFGQDPPDYDYSTVDVCLSCLERASAQVREFKKPR